MARAFIVFNPVAGGSGSSVRQTMEDHFAGAGRDYEIYETTGEEQIARVADQAVRGRLRSRKGTERGGGGKLVNLAE